MQVTVKLFASFREGRFASAVQDYPPATRIADVITHLDISEAEVGMIMLNHRHATPEELLEGAQLSLFPLLGGG